MSPGIRLIPSVCRSFSIFSINCCFVAATACCSIADIMSAAAAAAAAAAFASSLSLFCAISSAIPLSSSNACKFHSLMRSAIRSRSLSCASMLSILPGDVCSRVRDGDGGGVDILLSLMCLFIVKFLVVGQGFVRRSVRLRSRACTCSLCLCSCSAIVANPSAPLACLLVSPAALGSISSSDEIFVI